MWPTDKSPIRFGSGQHGLITGSNDDIFSQRRQFAEVADPGDDFDLVANERGLPVVDVMRPHDKDGSEIQIPFGRPTLCRGMFDGGGLHPTQILDVVDVPLAVNLVGLHDVQ